MCEGDSNWPGFWMSHLDAAVRAGVWGPPAAKALVRQQPLKDQAWRNEGRADPSPVPRCPEGPASQRSLQDSQLRRQGRGSGRPVGEGISSPSPPPLGSWLPSEDLCAIESCFHYFLSVSLWENHCPP